MMGYKTILVDEKACVPTSFGNVQGNWKLE